MRWSSHRASLISPSMLCTHATNGAPSSRASTGLAGTVCVTADDALLWTDGRYFLQAESELGPGWTLMRSRQAGVPALEVWLAERLPEVGVVTGGDRPVCPFD